MVDYAFYEINVDVIEARNDMACYLGINTTNNLINGKAYIYILLKRTPIIYKNISWLTIIFIILSHGLNNRYGYRCFGNISPTWMQKY